MITGKPLKFAQGVMKGDNATQAYIAAGYKARGHSAEQASSRLLKNVEVRKFLETEQAKINEKLQDEIVVNKRKVISELEAIAYSNIGDYLSFGPSGVVFKDSEKLGPEKIQAVAAVKQSQTANGTAVSFRLWDKIAALTKLGETVGMFKTAGEPVEFRVVIETIPRL